MAITFSAPTHRNNKCNIRSISLPTRSHPTTTKIDEELNKYKSREASSSTSTSGSISSSLSALDDLYKCLEDLLSLTSTREVLSRHRQEKCIDELLEGSVRLLDFCGAARDMALQIKEIVRSLQSALRRRKGDSDIDISIANFNSFRKKMNKDVKKLIAALKQTDNRHSVSPLLDQDHQLSAIVRVQKEINAMNISTFQSLSLFLSVSSSKPKLTKWSMVSKLIHKGSIACEEKEETVNELEAIDAALFNLSSGGKCVGGEANYGEKTQIAQRKLEYLEKSIQEVESGLDCVFRQLIKTRASLLNIISP